MPKRRRTRLEAACLGFGEVPTEQGQQAPTRLLLLNDGDLMWEDMEGLVLDEEQAVEIITEFLSHGTDLPIDYEHATLEAPAIKAPAAGWVKALEYVPGEGLYATVEWTQQAKAEIEAGQYRYHSPVIITDKESKKIKRLHSVALTNKPRTRHQRELLAASLSALVKSGGGVTTMEKLKAFLVGAGVTIADGADDEAILSAAIEYLGTAKSAREEVAKTEAVAASMRAKMGLAKDAGLEVIAGAIDSLQKSSVPADEYKALRGRLEALEAEEALRTSQQLVADAVEAGKLNPNADKQMEWARSYAKADAAGFRAWAASAAAIVTTGTITKSDGKVGGTREQLIAASLVEFKANRAKLAGVEPWAFVNEELRAAGELLLSSDERKTVKV